MLFEQIKTDRIQAMKDKAEIKKNLLGTLIAEASKESKTPDDVAVIATIKKFIKSAGETAAAIATRTESTVQLNQVLYERDILESYLPKQLTEDEVRDIILDIVGDCCDKPVKITLKDIMLVFKEDYAGQYDGVMVSRIAKELI